MDKVGVVRDLSPEQISDGGWYDISNVRLRNGKAIALPGYQDFVDGAVQVGTEKRIMHGDTLLLQSGLSYLVVFTRDSAYYFDSTSFTLIDTVFSGGDANLFMTDVAFDVFVICNGVEAAYKWEGPSGTFAIIAGMTDCEPGGVACIPKILRAYANFIVAFNCLEDSVLIPFQVRWAQYGELEIWKNDVDGNGQAGSNPLNDTPSPIMNALKINNYMAIYKKDGVYLMSYVGPPLVFAFQKVIDNRGLVAPRGVVSMGSVHYFLSDDGFYAFDGAAIVPIGQGIRDFILNDIKPEFMERTQAVIVRQYNEVWWAYCSTSSEGDFDKVAIYSYRTGAWSFADFDSFSCLFAYYQQDNVAWEQQPDALLWSLGQGPWNQVETLAQFPVILIGTDDSFVFQHGPLFSQDGASYVKSAQTKLYDFGRPHIKKRLRLVQFSLNTAAKTYLKVKIGSCDNPGDDITWTSEMSINTDHGSPRVLCDVNAVYFAVKIYSEGNTDPWEVSQMQAVLQDQESMQ